MRIQRGKINENDIAYASLIYDQQQVTEAKNESHPGSIWEAKEQAKQIGPTLEQAQPQKIQYKEKEFASSTELLLYLLKTCSSVVITLPLNDQLSPFVEGDFYKLKESFDLTVLGVQKKLVTICTTNKNNLAKGTRLHFSKKQPAKLAIRAKKVHLSEIPSIESNNLRVTNLGTD